MIRQAHNNFEQIMQHLNEAAQDDSTAYQVEHDLFRALLSLGATLLGLFFVLRAQAMRAQAPPAHARRQGSKKRRYFSLFGPIEIHFDSRVRVIASISAWPTLRSNSGIR